jgi:hypothetical protein
MTTAISARMTTRPRACAPASDALDEGRKLGLFEDVVEGSDLGGEENLRSLPRVATAPPVAPTGGTARES